jgi:DNA-binding PadR family transcriptional regulator
MREVTLLEEIILTTIWRLKEDAYGVAIRKKVSEILKKDLFYGTLYNALDQLVKKGYVSKEKSEPISSRGGRSRMYYTLTQEGIQALERARELHQLIWENLPRLAKNKR